MRLFEYYLSFNEVFQRVFIRTKRYVLKIVLNVNRIAFSTISYILFTVCFIKFYLFDFASCSGILHVGTVRHALLLGKGFLLLPILMHLLQHLMQFHRHSGKAALTLHKSVSDIRNQRSHLTRLRMWQVLIALLIAFPYVSIH